MKIVNNTSFNYETIGKLIDKIIEESDDDTHYAGQIYICGMLYKGKEIKVQIRYFKKYVEWRFDEVVVQM
jgi:hypothetical protein